MKNPKLAALYKELSWLEVIADEIGNPSVVKVKRLDAESITRFVGTRTTMDDSYWMRGYFFDGHGEIVSPIVPVSPIGITQRVRRILDSLKGKSNYVTVEDALRWCRMKDAVRYVVMFGHDLNHYCSLQLYVYKLPEGVMVSELLRNIDEERSRGEVKKQRVAEVEVATELEQAK